MSAMETVARFLSPSSVETVPDGPDLRIVMIGRTWMNWVPLLNALMRSHSHWEMDFWVKTNTCLEDVTRWGNRRVSVVYSPANWLTYRSDDKVRKEMERSLKLSFPGPHVFLLVLTLGRYTEVETDYVELLEELFGPEVFRYMMVVFTHNGQPQDATIQEHQGCLDFPQIVRKCGNRFHAFRHRNVYQVGDMIKEIDSIVEGNVGRFYTGNETVAVRGPGAFENLQRADSNVSLITSYQPTSDVDLVPTDTNSSQNVCRRDRAASSPSAGTQRLKSVQILFDTRSSFIERISGPVLKSLVDKLFEKDVLTDCERESADEMQSRADKARFVIDTVRRKGEDASSEMIQVLREVDLFLCEGIGLNHGRRAYLSFARWADGDLGPVLLVLFCFILLMVLVLVVQRHGEKEL